jgi:alkylated DNA nucleotide flippase Atl1
MKSKLSWREKLTKPQQPKLVKVPPQMTRFGTGTMLIPTPMLVDELVRRIPKGRLVTVGEIRRKLASDFGADVTCPLTTGIFVRIAAEAAEEDRANGRRRITPYWRVVKDDGSLNPKFPGGGKLQTRCLREEGLSVVRRGNRAAVKDFEQRLTSLK